MSAEEKNKALVRRFFEEAWVKGDVAAVDEFMATDSTWSTLAPPACRPAPRA